MTRSTTDMRKNMAIVAHVFTLLRILLTGVLSLCLWKHFEETGLPIVLSCAIYCTDYFDGTVARMFRCKSVFGAVFDVVADVCYVSTFYTVLCLFNITPFWFLWVILLKFCEFMATSYWLRNTAPQRDVNAFCIFDPLGKISALMMYVLPMITFISFHDIPTLYRVLIPGSLVCITCLAVVSSVYRLSSVLAIRRYSTSKRTELEGRKPLRGLVEI